MKVEFAYMNLGGGSNMVIGAKEFLKARDNDEEMSLLVEATECFTAPNCFEYCIDREEYDYIASWLTSSEKVVFAINTSNPYHRWLEVYVIARNTVRKIRYSTDNGEHITIVRKIGRSG